jgi:SPP1 family predicted phage head-tail adaptor
LEIGRTRVGIKQLEAGDLPDRLVVEQDTTGADASGGVTHSYSTFATVWGKIDPLTLAKGFQAKQANSNVGGTITIRFLKGLESTMRLRCLNSGLTTPPVYYVESFKHERKVASVIKYKEELD